MSGQVQKRRALATTRKEEEEEEEGEKMQANLAYLLSGSKLQGPLKASRQQSVEVPTLHQWIRIYPRAIDNHMHTSCGTCISAIATLMC